MKIFKESGKYYCKVREGYDFDKFDKMLASKLEMKKGSFADQYVKKIFRDCFRYSRNLNKEYKTYYIEEYDSFLDYLRYKEMIDINAANIDELFLELNMDLSCYNVTTIFEYDENGVDILNKVLENFEL